MPETAPYLINTGHVDLPLSFLIPICTTQERYDMMISALMVGGEVLYGEEEILHIVDFLNALPLVREDCNVDYDDLIAAIADAQADADAALAQIAALPMERHFPLYPDEATLIADSTAISINAAYVYGLSQFTSAAGAAMRWSKVGDLSLGGTFKIWHSKFPSGGISTLFINGVSAGTLNMYSAGTSHNNLATFNLAASVHGKARHQIDLQNTGAGTGAGRGQGLAKLWFMSN
jgi:hypothetical protein